MDSHGPVKDDAAVSEPPKDTFNLVYCIFILLGVSYVMPFTTFTAAIDYFELLYPTGQVNRVFTIAYMIPALTSILLLTCWGRIVPLHFRAFTGIGLSAVVLLIIPAMGALFDMEGTSATYAVTIACVAMVGAMSCLTEGSIIGAAGELPPRYMQAVMTGSAASGVLMSVLRLVLRAVMPQTQAGVKASAYLYFIMGAMILLACIASFNLVRKLPIMQYYSKMKRSSTSENASLLDHATHSNEDRGFAGKETGDFGTARKMEPISYRQVWKSIQGLALSVGFVYLVSVSIFPGHITEDFYSSYFGDLYPLLLILCFYLCDVVGKCLPNVPRFVNRKAAIGGSLARALFYPLFYLCIYGPRFFQTEAAVMILTCLLGLTNGYCMSTAMILSPKCVSFKEAEVAGFLMVVLIKVGNVAGSIGEWVWIL